MLRIFVLAAACIHGLASCRGQTVNFDTWAPGSVPQGWVITMTHAGGPPRWLVLSDSTAPSKPNVFAQVSSDPTAGRFPLAVFEQIRIANGNLSVRFKTIAGTVDQAAGLIWRYQDPENYYIARANALENNVVLYKVEKGQRLALAPRDTPSRAYGVKRHVPKGVWNTLAVEFEGDAFKVSLNGEMVLEVIDPTFPAEGKVGLWTKADSVTYFDDFQIVHHKKTRSR